MLVKQLIDRLKLLPQDQIVEVDFPNMEIDERLQSPIHEVVYKQYPNSKFSRVLIRTWVHRD